MPDEDHRFTAPRPDPERITLSAVKTDIEFIMHQLARLPTRNEVWRAAMLGMIAGAVAAVTLIEAFARACN